MVMLCDADMKHASLQLLVWRMGRANHGNATRIAVPFAERRGTSVLPTSHEKTSVSLLDAIPFRRSLGLLRGHSVTSILPLLWVPRPSFQAWLLYGGLGYIMVPVSTATSSMSITTTTSSIHPIAPTGDSFCLINTMVGTVSRSNHKSNFKWHVTRKATLNPIFNGRVMFR